MQVGEKVRCIFPMCCGPGGSKSRLAKAAGAEPSGQMRDKKTVARSTFRSQHVKNTPCLGHFWSHFVWEAQGILHLAKIERKVRVSLNFSKTMASVGQLKRICTDPCRLADVLGGEEAYVQCLNFGASDLQFVTVISRDRCSTLYDLDALFRGKRCTLERWDGSIGRRIGTRPSDLHSTFHVWKICSELLPFFGDFLLHCSPLGWDMPDEEEGAQNKHGCFPSLAAFRTKTTKTSFFPCVLHALRSMSEAL